MYWAMRVCVCACVCLCVRCRRICMSVMIFWTDVVSGLDMKEEQIWEWLFVVYLLSLCLCEHVLANYTFYSSVYFQSYY